MASEREQAKRAITKTESSEPELNAAFLAAQEFQHRTTVETNRHKEVMRAAELGIVGRALGGEANAPIAIALIAVICGIVGAFASGIMAAKSAHTDGADFWAKQVERSLSFAGVALSFIFGRSSNRR